MSREVFCSFSNSSSSIPDSFSRHSEQSISEMESKSLQQVESFLEIFSFLICNSSRFREVNFLSVTFLVDFGLGKYGNFSTLSRYDLTFSRESFVIADMIDFPPLPVTSSFSSKKFSKVSFKSEKGASRFLETLDFSNSKNLLYFF